MDKIDWLIWLRFCVYVGIEHDDAIPLTNKAPCSSVITSTLTVSTPTIITSTFDIIKRNENMYRSKNYQKRYYQ